MNFPLALTGMIVLVAISTVNCLRAIEEPQFNCQASKAASSPSFGKEMCSRVKGLEGVDQDEDEADDVVFECACALSTHTYWYKRIMSYPMKQLAEALDGANELYQNAGREKQVLSPRGAYFGSMYHLSVYLKERNDGGGLRAIKENIVSRFGENYFDIKTGDAGPWKFSDNREVIVKSCQQFLADQRLTGFVKPSLEAIEKSKFGGENLHRALIMGQPELSALVSVMNVCESFSA